MSRPSLMDPRLTRAERKALSALHRWLHGRRRVAAGPGVCRVCGCADNDCSQCVAKTGEPCHWVEPDLCSACEVRT
jgi:hypothetical protein